jgi:AraC-like DNA-binding protein
MDWMPVLRDFYKGTRVAVRVYDGVSVTHTFAAKSIEPDLAPALIPGALNCEAALGFILTEEQLFFGYVKVEPGEGLLLVGPTSAFKLEQPAVAKIMKKAGISSVFLGEAAHYLQTLPPYTLEESKHLLALLDALVNGQSGRTPARLDAPPGAPPRDPPPVRTAYIEHISPDLERELLSYVQYGRTDLLDALFAKWRKDPETVPVISGDAVRSLKNIFIQALGIVSRTALRGGLDYDTVMELSTYFLIKIEELTEYGDITNHLHRMFMTFANRVRFANATPAGGSLNVQKIKNVIFSRLHEKVTPTIIAEILKMDLSYLCKHFKAKTGKTISAYVHEVKIEECKRLLESSKASLLEIATGLGYSSQNYLASTFKKVTGMTPTEFRGRNRAESGMIETRDGQAHPLH